MAGISKYSSLIYAYLMLPIGFIIFILLVTYFSSLLGSEGDTKRATIILFIGNIINLVLDPIFMFNMERGMFGAGLATFIGYFVSFLLFLYLFFIKKNTVLKINFSHFQYDLSIFKEIIKLAIPIIIEGAIIDLIGVLINIGLHFFANPYAVVAYIILLKVQSVIFSPIDGYVKVQ